MLFSVIIPTMKGREVMLQKLLSTIPDEYEKIVVDDEDLLLAAKRNKGAKLAKGEYLFFVDDDNYLTPGAIEAALELAEKEGVGVVGFMACYDDKQDLVADGGSKRNYLTGFTTGINTNAFWPRLNKTPYEVDEVANAFMIHAELFFELQGFDDVNFPMDMNESDICFRIKKMGYTIMMNPLAMGYHKSQTYSCFPNFRKEMYAYFHGNGRVGFARKHYHGLCYWGHISIFLPLFLCFYTVSLLWRKNFKVIFPFLKGVFDGLRGRRTNKYQPR